MREHLRSHSDDVGPVMEEGLEFNDSGDESDDSGLQELLFGSNSES